MPNSLSYQLVKVNSQVAMNSPTDIYLNLNDVQAYSSLIPQCYEYAKKVHFVSDKQGNEFGQFPTKEQALKVAHEMAALTPKLRQSYDK
jgi:hypothetical protein